jgi:transposase
MLKPSPIEPVPEETARVARAAFRKGNPLLKLRDELGSIFRDEDFANLFPSLGQPGLPPWRLALATILQFRENLPDRQAAEAVRARIDWKYLLGLELDDPGFDHSVLCEFRARLLEGGAEERLLHKLLDACRARGLLKARGRQRTDATHVLASIRVLNRLELVGETMIARGGHPVPQGRGPTRPARAGGAQRDRGRRPGLVAGHGPRGLVQAPRRSGRGRPPAAGRGQARGPRAHRRRGRVRPARPP